MNDTIPLNDTIRLLQQHRSIRKFKPDPVPDELLETIVRSAQAASTSSNMQAYSVIAVTDADKKQRLAAVAGNQAYVEQCPLMLVWCADLNRNRIASERAGGAPVFTTLETFLIASVDTALAAQNAALAAESLGLGIVYIGGLRNDVAEVVRLLKLPKFVYPVFGMCVGFPDHDPGLRPRLPVSAVLHRETYDETPFLQTIDEYDQTMRIYYRERTGGRKETTWSQEMAGKFQKPQRPELRRWLEDQGFRFD